MGTVKTLISRLRKQYMAVVREEVGRTVSDPAEIEDELRALCNALTAPEGRLEQRAEYRRAMIGVGTTTQVAPPSEPGRRISGTRLSSWWLLQRRSASHGMRLF